MQSFDFNIDIWIDKDYDQKKLFIYFKCANPGLFLFIFVFSILH